MDVIVERFKASLLKTNIPANMPTTILESSNNIAIGMIGHQAVPTQTKTQSLNNIVNKVMFVSVLSFSIYLVVKYYNNLYSETKK